MQKTVDGTVTDYVYSGGYVIAETGKMYLRGLSYHAVIISNEFYYYFCNSHGDVTGITNEGGNTVATYDYDEFGNLISETGNFDNDIRYSGEFFDCESENYYLRSRYYDPTVGRFTQQDSFLGVDSNPLSLNRYTYCHNNPIMYVDPSGFYIMEQNINGMTVRFDTDQVTSSAMDEELGRLLYNAKNGNISMTKLFNESSRLGVTLGYDSISVGDNTFNVQSDTSYTQMMNAVSAYDAYLGGMISYSRFDDNLHDNGFILSNEYIEYLELGYGTASKYPTGDMPPASEIEKTDSGTILSSYIFLEGFIYTLERYADEYRAKNDVKESVTSLVLKFIGRKYYKGTLGNIKWNVVAGDLDENFVNYVLNEKNYELAKSEDIFLKDICTNDNIDIAHWAITLQSIRHTTSLKYITQMILDEKEVNNLAGWAGDLQQAIGDLQGSLNPDDSKDYDKAYSVAKEIIGGSNGGFSISDMLADVDAVNISKLLNGNEKLSTTVGKYYKLSSGDNGVKKRYTNFVSNVFTFTGKEFVRRDVGEILETKNIVGNSILKKYKKRSITTEELNALRDAFVNFIMNENEGN